jgi:hypothetical protein
MVNGGEWVRTRILLTLPAGAENEFARPLLGVGFNEQT